MADIIRFCQSRLIVPTESIVSLPDLNAIEAHVSVSAADQIDESIPVTESRRFNDKRGWNHLHGGV